MLHFMKLVVKQTKAFYLNCYLQQKIESPGSQGCYDKIYSNPEKERKC